MIHLFYAVVLNLWIKQSIECQETTKTWPLHSKPLGKFKLSFVFNLSVWYGNQSGLANRNKLNRSVRPAGKKITGRQQTSLDKLYHHAILRKAQSLLLTENTPFVF